MSILLGLDYGIKRVGYAIGDAKTKIVSPGKILNNDKNLIKNIVNIVKSYNISTIVLGYPITLKGKEGQRAILVKAFKEELEKEINIPIYLYDERFSTVRAKELNKKNLDAIAAYIILSDFINENELLMV